MVYDRPRIDDFGKRLLKYAALMCASVILSAWIPMLIFGVRGGNLLYVPLVVGIAWVFILERLTRKDRAVFAVTQRNSQKEREGSC